MALDAKEDAKEFGKKLKDIREDKKITATELAKRIGYSQPFISMLETGRKGIPKPETLRKLSDGLDVPYIELMTIAGHVNEDGAVPLDSFTDMMQPSSARKVKQGAMIASGKDGDSIYNGIDLHEELTKEQKVFYKDALLSDNDKQKIDAMIEVMIDKESN